VFSVLVHGSGFEVYGSANSEPGTRNMEQARRFTLVNRLARSGVLRG
jgi:hypothetical protein